MARGDCGLQRVLAQGTRERLRACESVKTSAHEELVPARPVLVQKQDWLAAGSHASANARCLQLHQCDEAVHLGVLGHELRKDSPEAQSILTKLRAHPVLAASGGVSLVEDEVDDLEDGRQPCGEVLTARNLEGYVRLRERPLRTDDALGDGR